MITPDVMHEAIRAAVERAMSEAPKPTLTPATCMTFDLATSMAMVVLDGDTEQRGAQVISLDAVGPGTRVMVLLVPPHGAYVIGKPKNGKLAAERRWSIGRFHLPTRNGAGWTVNNFTGSGVQPAGAAASGLFYNISPGGAVVGEIGYEITLPAGSYRCAMEYVIFNNEGNGEAFLNGVSFGTWDGYSATAGVSSATKMLANTVVLSSPGTVEFVIRKLGTKNAAANEYYVGFVEALLTRVA